MEPTKSILLSKTFWFNVLSIASALVASLTPVLEKDQALWAMRIFAYANPVINVLLRYVTVQPVSLKMPDTIKE